jgi:hypothetical protein
MVHGGIFSMVELVPTELVLDALNDDVSCLVKLFFLFVFFVLLH